MMSYREVFYQIKLSIQFFFIIAIWSNFILLKPSHLYYLKKIKWNMRVNEGFKNRKWTIMWRTRYRHKPWGILDPENFRWYLYRTKKFSSKNNVSIKYLKSRQSDYCCFKNSSFLSHLKFHFFPTTKIFVPSSKKVKFKIEKIYKVKISYLPYNLFLLYRYATDLCNP